VCTGRYGRKLLRFISVLCVGILLLNTYGLYKFAYFGSDAFNNLYWAQRESFTHIIGYILNPVSSYFRPVGMMYYWLFLRFFDLSPAAYRWLMWSLHAANTALVYFILKRLTRARPGAAIGAMLFASQAVFAEIYWNFGAVFELIAGLFSFAAILLWTSERRSWLQVLLASLALLLAVKSKEMAVSMPVIWFSYDLLLRRDMKRMMAAHWVLPGGLAVWYGLSHALAMRGIAANDPYHMSIDWSILASGFATYFNVLCGTELPWQIWWIASLVILLVFVLLRSRLALFFQLYVFVTFLPVIFLVNHRVALFWYFPFLGVCGFAAILANAVACVINGRNPRWLAETGSLTVFALLCWATFLLHEAANRPQRSWVSDVADEYHAFVSGLRALPPPPRGETIFFDSLPPHFEETVLLTAAQVALRRTDLHTKLVSEFPPEARYRLRFQKSHLIQLPR
jgi:hypothetical protein